MKTTDKTTIRQLASLLAQYGVKYAVMSPGSRNAPILVALERQPAIETYMVIDERSAAFIALGMADTMQSPVALVCTSGTAPLNYAPAVAEAYYRNVPLIIITADRPSEWIDQDDSQTINQQGIYNNYIKGSFDIPVESSDPDRMWYVNRTINDALALAVSGRPGPVHINVRISEPLGNIVEVGDEPVRKIALNASVAEIVPDSLVDELAEEIRRSRAVLFLAGFMPQNELADSLLRLAALPNVVVMHEAQSNICHSETHIPNIDVTLRYLPADAPDPDLVITLGGSLTSRMVKTKLRSISGLRHWSVGLNDRAVDCFRHLTRRLPYSPERLLPALAERLGNEKGGGNDFRREWLDASRQGNDAVSRYAEAAPWSDFKAMFYVMSHLSREIFNLHLSNGTAVRYAQLFPHGHYAAISCNRGVSGIDGCTSTAIGSAVVSDKPTLLISGDMSFQYDLGALATTFIPKNFKVIVLSNGGGGIFRFIASTRHLEELDRCFAGPINLPLRQISQAYGMNYFVAGDMAQLETVFDAWLKADGAPSILEIVTDGNVSAQVLTQFFQK